MQDGLHPTDMQVRLGEGEAAQLENLGSGLFEAHTLTFLPRFSCFQRAAASF